MKTVTLPSTVKEIADSAFWYCDNLTSINLEDTGIETIGVNTFSGCTSLANVILPDTVKTIGIAAFQSCTGLTDLYFTSTNVPKIVENSTSSGNFTAGAFLNADAEGLTIHYPSSWGGNGNLETLQDAIEKSGMKNVDDTHPTYLADSPPATLSLLDAARFFGL